LFYVFIKPPLVWAWSGHGLGIFSTPDRRQAAWILGFCQVVWVVWAIPYYLFLLQIGQWNDLEILFFTQ